MLHTFFNSPDNDIAVTYTRQFESLADLAAELDLPASDAEVLIHDILLSALLSRATSDVDTWLKGALQHAVAGRRR